MTTQSLEHTRPMMESREKHDAALTVRARSTCAGAHVHVGSLRMPHEDVSAFARQFQARQDASMLAALTASAVNDIQSTLAPRMGLRVYAVEATASSGEHEDQDDDDIGLELFFESPDSEPALRSVVEAWLREYASAMLPAGPSLRITLSVVDWYGTN